MATVFLARDIRHDRNVAVKVLHPDLAAAIGKERFLREVQITAQLTHPHIMPLLDSGEQGGLLFYVMPFVAGETVRARLTRTGPLPLDEAIGIAREVADAIGYAHGRGFVHRDIKPENILIEEGHAIVVDFGIARAVGEAASDRLTVTGMAIGTPQYMSPEQMEGLPNIDPRSDVYAIGCVLYEMIAGSPPYAAPTTQALMARRMTEPAPSVRISRETVSPALDATLQRALQRNPADRFQTASELSKALTNVTTATTITAAPAVTAPQRTRRWIAPAVVVGVALVAAGAWWKTRPSQDETIAADAPSIASIAVLPFVNASSDTANEYFADGLTDELITSLSSVQGLKVASRTSSFTFKGQDVDAKEIGRKLGVTALLEGTVRRAEGRMRISARLIGVEDGYQRWAKSYERDVDDVLAVQEEIADSIVARLTTASEQGAGGVTSISRSSDAAAAPSADAYDLFLRGRFFRNKRTDEGLRRAVEYFKAALEQSPRFARAHSGLAETYAVQGFYNVEPPRVVFPLAKQSATEALRVDPTLGAAHTTLGYVALYYDWDWASAQREFERGIKEDPGYATAHQWYANYLTAMGRFDEAERSMRNAHELDPLATITRAALGWTLYHKGDFDRAITELRATFAIDTTFALTYLWLGQTYEVMGRLDESVQMLRRGVDLAPSEPSYKAVLARTLARRGDRAEAERLLKTVEATRIPPSFEIAKAYLALGNKPAALRWLQRAYDERSHSMALLRVDPQLSALRSDSTFSELARRVGLN
jgi:serine/threonine-protein kinase